MHSQCEESQVLLEVCRRASGNTVGGKALGKSGATTRGRHASVWERERRRARAQTRLPSRCVAQRHMYSGCAPHPY